QVQLVDQPGHQRQLLRRTNRSANTRGPLGRRLPPRGDVLQRLGEVKLLDRVVKADGEAFARQSSQVGGRKPSCVVQNLAVQRRVVPPVGRDLAQSSHVVPPANRSVPSST